MNADDIRLIRVLVGFAALSLSFPALSQGTGENDSCLAFNMPSSEQLFASQKKVFAHYFPAFPLSIDNKEASADYYNRNHLSPNGESNKWVEKGGYLRQRPLPVAVNSDVNWKQHNVETEVRMAIARGITGFTIDVLSLKEAIDDNGHVKMLLRAAQAVDPRFKIVVMPDIQGFKQDSDSVTKVIAAVASSPAAYKLPDGRLVVTAFNAGGNTGDWWRGVFDNLSAQGIKVAFVPTFLGWKGKASEFAGVSYGYSDWGTATANSSRNQHGDASAAHAMNGKIYMMPVDPQQYRPKGPIFWEAGNSEAFRSSWKSAIDDNSDWIQVVTWSDFSESSQIEPYTDATLSRSIGVGYYNLNAYYAAWFLVGKAPAITHDVLYYFYRREPTGAAAPKQAPIKVVSSVGEDNIEMVALLSSPGTLKISIGGRDFTQNAPAGLTSFKVPAQPGTPKFSVVRNGSAAVSFDGGVQIYGSGGLPSGVLDLTYWSGSGSSKGVCTL